MRIFPIVTALLVVAALYGLIFERDRIIEFSAGLSAGIIDGFFRPFLQGVFLSPLSQQSSRLFEFVFGVFSTGAACLPAGGIGAVAEQMAADPADERACNRTLVLYDDAITAGLGYSARLIALSLLGARGAPPHGAWVRAGRACGSPSLAPRLGI